MLYAYIIIKAKGTSTVNKNFRVRNLAALVLALGVAGATFGTAAFSEEPKSAPTDSESLIVVAESGCTDKWEEKTSKDYAWIVTKLIPAP